MSLAISKRAEKIVQAEIRAMSLECEKVSGINLAQGVCDTEVPLSVRKGAQKAIDEGINSYTRYDGLARLRKAIATKMSAYNGISADAEKEIVVSSGSTGSFYCACLALLNPGDEVIIFEPYYGYHINTLLAAENVPVYVRLKAPHWSFSKEDLQKALTSKTRAIIVNTPANPTGKIFSQTELEWIADFAKDNELFVFTDEIYEYFLYDDLKHISPATLPGMKERTITISGYSKTFSVTGWRIGYSVSDARWAQMMGYINDLIYVCAPAPLQIGVAEGINDLPASYYDGLRSEYQAKRTKLCSILEKVGLPPCVPQGAYYVLADVSRLPGLTSKEKAMYLLNKTGVASVPDEAFISKPFDKQYVRFCFAKKDEQMEMAYKRLERL